MAIVAGLFAGLFGRLPQQAAALLAWPFPAYTIRVVEWRAGLPGSAIVVGTPRAAAVAAFYLVLFGITFGWPAWRRWRLARRAEAQPGAADSERPAPERLSGPWGSLRRLGQRWLPAGVLGLAALVVVVRRLVLNAPDDRLHLTVLDVGGSAVSGEGLLIQTPGSRSVLVKVAGIGPFAI